MTVGFIGLGQIGTPMATRLLDHPDGLVVCDIRPEATEPFVAGGATAVTTPREVAAAGATVISVMVRDDAQVRDVLFGETGIVGHSAPGTVVLVHSTISAETAVSVAAEAAAAGVDVIDAPVSGGFMGAHAGTLAIMVGGPAEALELARPVLDLMASLVVHAGPVGAGTTMKVARNLITFTSYAVVGEALRLAEAAGIGLVDLGNVVRHSDRITGGPGAIILRPTAAPIEPGDGMHPIITHTRGLGEKDLELALDLAAQLGIELPLTTIAAETLGGALGVPHEEQE